MIIALAKQGVHLLLNKKLISASKKRSYQYGMELLISTVINVIIVLLIGSLFHKLPETTIFLLFFCTLKRYTGGLHMSTYASCITTFSCIYLFLMIFDCSFRFKENTYFTVCICLLNGLILFLTPLEDPGKKLSDEEKRVLKKKIYFTLSFFTTIFLFTICIVNWEYSRYIGFAMLVLDLLVITGHMKNHMTKGEKEKHD